MAVTSLFDDEAGVLRRDGAALDPWGWRWQPAGPAVGTPVTDREALTRLTALGAMRAIPVGVIGPRDATRVQLEAAEAVGAGIAGMGLVMMCGGHGGVMAAASKGAREAGGLTIGMLPGHDWREANPDIRLPIATGLSEARNMIIAKASAVLVAVGGSYGTLSEVAYGLHFGKPVIGIENPPEAPGLEHVESPEAALDRLANHLLAQADMS